MDIYRFKKIFAHAKNLQRFEQILLKNLIIVTETGESVNKQGGFFYDVGFILFWIVQKVPIRSKIAQNS